MDATKHTRIPIHAKNDDIPQYLQQDVPHIQFLGQTTLKTWNAGQIPSQTAIP